MPQNVGGSNLSVPQAPYCVDPKRGGAVINPETDVQLSICVFLSRSSVQRWLAPPVAAANFFAAVPARQALSEN